MGRGKALTNQEYWWIIGLHDGGVSLHDISRKTGRSRTCVRRAIKTERGPQTDSGCDKPRAGRRLALTEREVRVLVRTAASGEHFAAELKTKLAIKASVRTIQRMLQRVDHLVYTKMDRTLPLTAAHKAARMAWAEEHILNPDGFKYYWRDMRRPAQSFVRCQNGGGSVMVWGAFSAQAR
uniref:Tc3 transposase DNA binding domain-containing protein n=1 Tax=Phytophthora ramorum TaxID=164328 RepID=H3H1V8_PHYRM